MNHFLMPPPPRIFDPIMRPQFHCDPRTKDPDFRRGDMIQKINTDYSFPKIDTTKKPLILDTFKLIR